MNRNEHTKRKAWEGVLPDLVPDRVTAKPRRQGLTMMLDRCQGLTAMQDLLDMTGEYLDHLKLSFGTAALLGEALLRRKIELVRAYDIDIYPGGTLMEVSMVQGVYPDYVRRAEALGFTTLEISDGTITLSRQTRDDAIKRALDAGLKVVTEVGKKDRTLEVPVSALCDQIEADLAVGADKVIMEARESGMGIGIYDQEGLLRIDKVTAILEGLGGGQHHLIWEAPRQRQQAALILQCGPNVNLGNVKPRDVLGLEALRRGLRFETFRHFAPQLRPKETVHERA